MHNFSDGFEFFATAVNSLTKNTSVPLIGFLKPVFDLNAKQKNSFNLDGYRVKGSIYKNERVRIFELTQTNANENKNKDIIIKSLYEIGDGNDLRAKQAFDEEFQITLNIQKIDSGGFFINLLGNDEKPIFLLKQKMFFLILEKGLCSLDDVISFRSKNRSYYKEPEICSNVYHLLQGFALLEKHGYAHCDIKPRNILVFKKEINGKIEYFYKITDFGISLYLNNLNKIYWDDLKGYTKFYCAKEILDHKKEIVDPYLSDVYSLGVTILEMMGLSSNKIVKIINKKNFPYRIRKNYPNLAPLVLEMLNKVKNRKRFIYFEEKIKAFDRYPPNEKNYEIFIQNKKSSRQIIAENFKIRTYIKENFIILNKETPKNREKIIDETWEKMMRELLEKLFQFRIISNERKIDIFYSISQINKLIPEAIEFEKEKRFEEAEKSMREAIILSQKEFGQIFQVCFCQNFLLNIYRKERDFKKMRLLILKENYLNNPSFIRMIANKMENMYDPEIYDQVFLKNIQNPLFDCFPLFNIFSYGFQKLQNLHDEKFNSEVFMMKLLDPFSLLLKKSLTVQQFSRYINEPDNLLMELAVNSEFLRTLNECSHLYYNQKETQSALKILNEFLTINSFDIENENNEFSILMKAEIYLLCGEIYKNDLIKSKSFFKKGYNLILFFFKNYEIKSSIYENYQKRIKILIENIKKILKKLNIVVGEKNLLGENNMDVHWNSRLKLFELLDNQASDIRELKELCDLNNFLQNFQ